MVLDLLVYVFRHAVIRENIKDHLVAQSPLTS